MFRPPHHSATLWRHADFLKLWAAQAVSAFGARITREGLPLAAVLTIDATPVQLGLLAAMSTGPGIVVGLFAGGPLDRSRRRPILIVSDLLRACVLMTVPVAAWFGALSMPQIYAVAVLVGAAAVLFDIADNAYLPSLIERTALMEGNAKLNATESLAEIGGPAIAGALFQAFTAATAIVANAATYLLSAVVLATIRATEPAPRPPATPHTVVQDIAVGAAAVFRHALVRPIFLMIATATFFGSFFAALYVLFAIETLDLSPAMLGVTIAIGGGGALVGAFAGPALSRRFGIGATIVLASFGCGLATLLIPLADGPPVAAMALLMTAQFFGDGLAVAAAIAAVSLRQSVLPNDVMGRVGALFHVGTGLAAVAGAVAGGLLAVPFGMRQTLLIGALGLIAAPLWGLVSPLARLRAIPAAEDRTAG